MRDKRVISAGRWGRLFPQIEKLEELGLSELPDSLLFPCLMEEGAPCALKDLRSYWKPPLCAVFMISHVVSEKSEAFPVTGFLC